MPFSALEPVPVQTLLLLDAAFRSGAIGLMLLTAVLLRRARGHAARFGVALMIAAVCAAMDGMAGLRLPFAAAALCAIGSSLAVPLFWLFARAWFDDGFQPRLVDALATLVFAGLGVFLQTQTPSLPLTRGLDLTLYVVGTAMAGHAQWLVWRGREDDLVEERRRARSIFVLTVGLVIVWSLWSEAYVRMTGPSLVLGAINGAVLAVAALGVAVMLFDVRHDGAFVEAPAPPAEEAAPGPIDPDLTRALDRLMAVERLYRSPELTIGGLAARLGAPEYRVRRHINGGLGHRNFAEYLNAQRLTEVRQALADREQAKVPILTIAMDAGFGSLVAFNRAFKTAMGETPTDYRRRAMGAQT